LTELLPREIFTGIISMKSGRQGINHSGTEAGQEQEGVHIVQIIKIAWAMDYITGMETGRMHLFVIMK
jgi:hypothetical protein